nr:MAG TPA: hypothetical protein [Caudoviricetes sp.]
MQPRILANIGNLSALGRNKPPSHFAIVLLSTPQALATSSCRSPLALRNFSNWDINEHHLTFCALIALDIDIIVRLSHLVKHFF